MIKVIARFWARRAYLWKLELESHTHDLHAKLSALHAQQKRDRIEHLNKEADFIEQHIAAETEKDEYKNLQGQEKYEADKELHDAEQMIKNNRDFAQTAAKEIEQLEGVADHFRKQAAQSRAVADEIRKL
jgi:hypothetical protein